MTRKLISFVSCSLLCLCIQTSAALAGDWEYRADLGGWLDKDTGLVWGDHSDTVSFLLYGEYASVTWAGAQAMALDYRVLTGFSDWRLPTAAEGQLAVAHGLAEFYNDYDEPWTSTEKGKSAYIFHLGSGNLNLVSKSSVLCAIFVRNSVPPPPKKPGKNK